MVEFAHYIKLKGEPIICETRTAIAVDEDVSLCDMFNGEQGRLVVDTNGFEPAVDDMYGVEVL